MSRTLRPLAEASTGESVGSSGGSGHEEELQKLAAQSLKDYEAHLKRDYYIESAKQDIEEEKDKIEEIKENQS